MELSLKPSHAKVKDYYNALNQFGQLNISHETAVRQAFASLLDTCARQFKWKLVQEFRLPAPKNRSVIVDGCVLDSFTLKHGFWEAKDLKDQLEKEIKKKLEQGYPRNNIIFQSPEKAILYQKGVRQGLNEDITDPDNLVDLLKEFFKYREPQHEEWEAAVADFSSRIPEIAAAVRAIIEKERKTNKKFVASFEGFVLLCRQAINPNLSDDAVETMLIQHLLTERIFRRVFNNPEFTRRNIIAAEIEKVIDSLTSRHFSRDAFLKDLDRFYHAIEINAENATDFSEKQAFLNTVYERFFQGFSPKEADTHGIVYTPQPIVNFMVRSVEEILKKEFGKSLGDREVHILDPFVGTGNFIVRVMQEIPKTRLQYKYENELHCNEVMLLPYYIASMNIEHAYLEATDEYKPFEGICLVDTFELAEASQASLFTAENTVRVEKQKQSPIFVIIGNPPYNSGQQDENDRNKNRVYETLDQQVAATYGTDSTATLRNSLRDPYIKAFRWASNRLKDSGVLAFVTNSGFLDGLATDGMRKHLGQDFDAIYILDLGGNVRKNPKLSGTTHNVFGIQVGVSINLLVRRGKPESGVRAAEVFYWKMPEFARKEAKYSILESMQEYSSPDWTRIHPTASHRWLTDGANDFDEFVVIGSKEAKRGIEHSIFTTYCNGQKSNSDSYVYDFDREVLLKRAQVMVANFNEELNRYRLNHKPENLEDFLQVDEKKLKWIRNTKRHLLRGEDAKFSPSQIRKALYRPYVALYSFFNDTFNEDLYQLHSFFPITRGPTDNVAVALTAIGNMNPFQVLASNVTPDLHLTGDTQCFPFYTYDEDGTNRRENITDWALDQFRSHYKDKSISKWDIFYYTYAVLHHPEYRTRYAANLKRELPRIPYAPDFHAFAKAGKRLAELHVDYEKQKEYPLERREKPGEKLNLRVEKMRLSKDKQTLVYNDFLTLTGIPKETYDYRLGNRSALEWVIDQYQISTDKRSGIANDPNRDDDKEYILRLIGQVITVSLETVKIVNALPGLGLPKETSTTPTIAKATTIVQ
ncbi:MAG TPA: type ISP restriction/modification enzyme [Candidatus Angelobacter sp.]|nr:type ISP restriction/modification enzyme [Candidatus Angelobacter sp.]